MNVSFSPNRIQDTDIENSLNSTVKKQKPMPVEVTRILQPEEQSHVPLKLTIRWKQNETALSQEEQPHVPLMLTIRWKQKEKANVSLPFTLRLKGSEDASLSEKNMPQKEIYEPLQESPSSKRKRREDPAQTNVVAKRSRVEVNQRTTASKMKEINKQHLKSNKEVKKLAHSSSEENIDETGEEQDTPNIRATKVLDMITTNALATKKALSHFWTPEEDQKLLAGVKLHGHKWTLISREYLEGRYTRGQCGARYRNYIHPNRIKGHWSEEERQNLLAGVEKFGVGKWAAIAKDCFNWTRTDNDIKTQYDNVLNPAIKRGFWTPKEDAKLIKFRSNGLKWVEIAEQIGRSSTSCRQRFPILTRE